MEILFILLAILLMVIGLVGAIIPALPGPPLSYLAMVIVFFALPGYLPSSLMIVMLALTVIVMILDYVAPIWLTKLGGGSKQAMWGSTVGVIVGLFFMPIGLILGPLVGAFIGEMMHQNEMSRALRVALMSFVAFLLTTGLKLVLSLFMSYYVCIAIYDQVCDSFSLPTI